MVTAHGMRGLHSSLALAAGTSSHVVAASLGHESIKTTLESYADPDAVRRGQQRAALTLLEGGKSLPPSETVRSRSVSKDQNPASGKSKGLAVREALEFAVELKGIEPSASRVRF